MSIWQHTKELAATWADAKKRQLQGRPNTRVDSGGTRSQYEFGGQDIDRDELRDLKEMRETGGIISHLVHAKAMMQFGTGAEFQAEEDSAAEWLHDQFNDLDNLLIDIGEDATWFPYTPAEIVETKSGGFSHVEIIEPWTMLPVENEVGEVVAWEQEIQGDFGASTETFQPDEIASFVLNKNSGRDKTGISEVLRAEDEVMHFKENQKTINDALEFLVPHNHWIVGSDDGAIIDDNELRRVRNMVQDMQGDTQFITGPDVKHDSIDLPEFDLKEITNNDLRQVCVALGVPIELASVISEGLGSGEQSGVRENYFELEKRAKQRSLGGQFVEQIARPLLEEYSEFDSEQELDLVFQESETLEEKKTVVDAIGGQLTNNEKRQLFDYSELDDEEKGESFTAPGSETGEDEEDEGDGGPFSGLMEDGTGNRNLSDEELAGTPEWDQPYLDLHDRVWTADGENLLASFSPSGVPDMVKENLREAILGGSLFSEIESIPSDQRMQLQNFLIEQLEDENWNIDGIANRLQDLDGGLSMDQAEVIARTEVASAVNSARENAYTERDAVDDSTFYWTGKLGPRTTEACTWLINKTNPHHGGTPVSLEELKSLIEEAPSHDPDMQDDLARPDDFVVHPNERKTWVRHVG